jgi:hypothetical protein
MKSQNPGVQPRYPSAPEIFRLPIFARILGALGVPLFSGLSFYCIYATLNLGQAAPGWDNSLLGAACFGVFAALALVTQPYLHHNLIVEPTGITSKWLGFQSATLTWSDISLIQECAGEWKIH